jgi:hypothetical protein
MANDFNGQDLIPKGFLDHAIKEFQKLQEIATAGLKETTNEAKKLVKETKNYNAATKSGQQAITEAEKRTRQLANASRNYRNSIDATEKQIVKLKIATQQQNKINRLNAQSARAAAGSYDKLSAEYQINRIKLAAMTEEMRKNTKQGKLLEAQTRSIYAEMQRLNPAMGKGAISARAYGGALAGAKSQATMFASALGFSGLIFGIAMAMRNGIRMMKEYEFANAELAAVLGTTRENTTALQQDSDRLGRSTVKTATEVTNLQIEYARLGFQQRQIINMTESTIQGSIAMNSELGDTAKLAGAIVRAFDNIDSSAMPRVMDMLVTTTQKSSNSFETLATSIPKAAGAANAMGISLEDMLSQLAIAQDATQDASIAGTSLRNIYLELAKSGMSLDEALTEINTSQNKVTASVEMFGRRTAIAALALANQRERTMEVRNAMDELGTAADAAREMQNTLSGEIALTKSAWEGFVLSLENGEGRVTKVISGILGFFRDILYTIEQMQGDFSDVNQQLTRTWEDQVNAQQEVTKALNKGSESGMRYREVYNSLQEMALMYEKAQTKTGVATEETAKVIDNITAKLDRYKKLIKESAELESGRENFLKLLERSYAALNSIKKRGNDLNDQELGYVNQLKKDIADYTKKRDGLKESQVEEREELNKLIQKKKEELLAVTRLQAQIEEEADSRNENAEAIRKEVEAFEVDDSNYRSPSVVNDGDIIKRIDSLYELRMSEIAIMTKTEREKDVLRLEAEKARLEQIIRMNEVANMNISENQIQAMKNTITAIENDITDIQEDKSMNFYDAIGMSESHFNRALSNVNTIINSFAAMASARVEAARAAKQASADELAAAQEFYREQEKLKDEGLAHDLSRAAVELREAEKRDAQNIKRLEKAEKAERQINEAQTIGAMTVATANIFKGFSKIPLVGQILAVAAVASMFASFVSAKAQAKKSSKYGKGGIFDINSGGSHESGNDTSLGIHSGRERKVERGEKVGVLSKKAVRQYGSGIDDIIESLNNGDFEQKFFADKDYLSFNSDGGSTKELLEAHMAKIEQMNLELSRIPRTEWTVGRKGIEKTVTIGRTKYLDIQEENKFGA